MIPGGHCLCGRKPDHLENTHVVNHVTTWPFHIWHWGLNQIILDNTGVTFY